MSTPENSRRPWRGRRGVVGAGIIAALVVVSLLTFGAATGRPVAQHRSGDASTAGNATSSTHQLSRAQGHASNVSRVAGNTANSSSSTFSSATSSLSHNSGSTSNATGRLLASITGCGADGSIADATG